MKDISKVEELRDDNETANSKQSDDQDLVCLNILCIDSILYITQELPNQRQHQNLLAHIDCHSTSCKQSFYHDAFGITLYSMLMKNIEILLFILIKTFYVCYFLHKIFFTRFKKRSKHLPPVKASAHSRAFGSL